MDLHNDLNTSTDTDRRLFPVGDQLPQPIATDETRDGEIPFERGGDRDAFEAIRAQVRRLFEFSTEEGLKNVSESLSPNVLRVDQGVNERISIDVSQLEETFRFWHVESLLDQAADMLDRGIRTRTEWNDLAVKSINLGLDLEEYFRLDEIHQNEIAQGVYTLAYKETLAEWLAEIVMQMNRVTLGQHLETIQTFIDDNQQRKLLIARAEAFLSAMPDLQRDIDEPNAGYDLSQIARNPVISGHILKPFLLDMLANERRGFDITEALQELTKDQHSNNIQSSGSDQRTRGVFERARWSHSNIEFKRRRTLVSRQLADLRAKAATMAQGVLNYPERMAPVRRRFDQDFREALTRLHFAQQGLTALYGYTQPLPDPVQSLFAGNTIVPESQDFFDECLLWVREAISYVIRFTQLDQNYAMPVSVRTLLGETSWTRSLSDWREHQEQFNDFLPLTLRFDLPENIFDEQRHVRLRGVSAFVVGDRSRGVWQLTARPPAQSFCHHLRRVGASSGEVVNLDQSRVPPIRLGRVTTREHQREPDVTGISALHNVSPFSTDGELWSIRLSGESSEGVLVSDLQDIQLDLHVAMRFDSGTLEPGA